MKFDLYQADGTKKGDIEGSDALFAANINADLMHRAILLRLANARKAIAHVKTRAEVAYSTKKLFRQKGTGNARRGARSTNLLRGGGVTHGPRNNANYSKMMPKKERRAALFSALSAKAKEGRVFGLAGFDSQAPKTKDFVSLQSKLPQGKRFLYVLAEKNEVFQKSVNNIPNAQTILAAYLNPFDVLHNDQICFVGDSISKVESTFLPSAQ